MLNTLQLRFVFIVNHVSCSFLGQGLIADGAYFDIPITQSIFRSSIAINASSFRVSFAHSCLMYIFRSGLDCWWGLLSTFQSRNQVSEVQLQSIRVSEFPWNTRLCCYWIIWRNQSSPRRIFTSLPLFTLQNQFSSHDHLTDYQVFAGCATDDEFSDLIELRICW